MPSGTILRLLHLSWGGAVAEIGHSGWHLGSSTTTGWAGEGELPGPSHKVVDVSMGPDACEQRGSAALQWPRAGWWQAWGTAWGQAGCPLRPLSQGWAEFLLPPFATVYPRAGKWSQNPWSMAFPAVPLRSPGH